MSFDSLGQSAGILRALAEKGYLEPTPVQQQAIPYVYYKAAISWPSAQTGIGETAAFTLPILQLLEQRPAPAGKQRRSVRALILTPTRELAVAQYRVRENNPVCAHGR